MRGAIAGLMPVPKSDQSALLTATAELLAKHVTFRPDGTASSICTFSHRQHVEWQKLVVKHISLQSLNEADRLNGITKRYLVSLSCDAHRIWDNKTSTWSKWNSTGHLFFPSALIFDWNGTRWTAKPSHMLKHFQPGPGPSIAAPKPTADPRHLPPGMTRGK